MKTVKIKTLSDCAKIGDEPAARRWLEASGLLGIGAPDGAKRGKEVLEALRLAAQNGHVAIVEMLLPLSSPKEDGSQALRSAAMNGRKAVVKMLIPVSDPKARASEALRWAAQGGHKEVVEMLLPVSDTKTLDSQALMWAAQNGHKKIVEMLIPVSDPKANDSEALCWAAQNGHKAIVELLLEPSCSPEGQLVEAEKAIRLAKASGFDEVAGLIEAYALSRKEKSELEAVKGKESRKRGLSTRGKRI